MSSPATEPTTFTVPEEWSTRHVDERVVQSWRRLAGDVITFAERQAHDLAARLPPLAEQTIVTQRSFESLQTQCDKLARGGARLAETFSILSDGAKFIPDLSSRLSSGTASCSK
ncbi:hypothetical protein QR680_008399 [Steinernema hermaphroditum]|uniref:Uncharacterized protein n=1 Tax=Steinernema hermaphroditum TaxID=289476 RepID=A0AA39IGG2_9BILA|nr:hypothetical protein QR680_008399 [Steinernema hermaphroditum]